MKDPSISVRHKNRVQCTVFLCIESILQSMGCDDGGCDDGGCDDQHSLLMDVGSAAEGGNGGGNTLAIKAESDVAGVEVGNARARSRARHAERGG